MLLWYALQVTRAQQGWTDDGLWWIWQRVHGGIVALALALTVILTVYSLADYLRRHWAAARAL